MQSTPTGSRLLPENAYRKLKEGEHYIPIVPAGKPVPEVTPWSVTLGLIMVAIFTAAAVYIALRAGSGIEAAIPIAVAAIFFGRLRKIRSSINENVMVQSIGQASGVVAAGAAFVVPALYINQVEVEWWQIFIACFLGGSLGVVLIIPLRKFFVADRHGELPFPEGTATTEILVSGESSGAGAGKVLLASFGLGAAYDLLVESVHAWNPVLSTKTLLGSAGDWLYRQGLELKLNAIAALFGLGYIIGLKYAAIIAAGSVFGYVLLGPIFLHLHTYLPDFLLVGNAPDAIAAMTPGQIFGAFIKPIGIGAIATAGIIGLIRMGKIIASSVALGFKGAMQKTDDTHVVRTQRDLKPGTVLGIQGLSVLGTGILFFVVSYLFGGYAIGMSALYAFVGMLVAFIMCFLFTPVAAEAIAIVGTNPVSGMTLVTVVLSSIVMAAVGLQGKAGIFVALTIGTVVCTALSTSGALISDFKIGYWIGTTPRSQQVWKFVGLGVAALVVSFVIPLMDQSYHFLVQNASGEWVSNEDVLPAPQANMQAVVVKGLMSGAAQPYVLYGVGAIISVIVFFLKIPALAFALGIYLPIHINLAVLAGGFAAWIVNRSGKTQEVKKARENQGLLIASGLMAGAAIAGIVSAALRLEWLNYPLQWIALGKRFFVGEGEDGATFLKEVEVAPDHWFDGFIGQGIGLLLFVGLFLAVFWLAKWGANLEAREQKRNG